MDLYLLALSLLLLARLVPIEAKSSSSSSAVGAVLCDKVQHMCPGPILRKANAYVCQATNTRLCVSRRECDGKPNYEPVTMRSSEEEEGGGTIKLFCVKPLDYEYRCEEEKICKLAFACDKRVCEPNFASPYSSCEIKRVSHNGPRSVLRAHGNDPLTLVNVDSTHFSCVDARSRSPVLGAFAGDFGELLLGFDVLRRHRRKQHALTQETVLEIVREFVQLHTTRSRPL